MQRFVCLIPVNPSSSMYIIQLVNFLLLPYASQELNKDTMIKASNGKLMPALSIFTHALRFFKEHALQELSDQSSTKILNEDVRWVITVPAIWKAAAKQFMRQAAYNVSYRFISYIMFCFALQLMECMLLWLIMLGSIPCQSTCGL